jgi:hypothetical protein
LSTKEAIHRFFIIPLVAIDQIKAKQNEHHRILAVEEEHRHNIEDRVRKLELGNRELENENIERHSISNSVWDRWRG